VTAQAAGTNVEEKAVEEATAAAAAAESAVVAAAEDLAVAVAAAEPAPTATGDDAMDEDEDELEAALRMSMQADTVSEQSPLTNTADSTQVPAPAGGAAAEAPDTSVPPTAPPSGGERADAATAGASSVPAAGAQAPADAGIDPAFLAELPEDLRAEVMAQQVTLRFWILFSPKLCLLAVMEGEKK